MNRSRIRSLYLKNFVTAAYLALLSCLPIRMAEAAIPAPPTFATGYRLKFAQDFTTLTSLAVATNTMSAGNLWTAHKPGGGDWFVFSDPVGDYNPFHLGGGNLVIRVARRTYTPNQQWFSGYSGGLLSSMDGSGAGFGQQYGYFECSMQCPGSPNTWPAFWLLDAPSLTTATPYAAEIDVTESYGNWGTGPNQVPAGNPNVSVMAWHNWGHSGNPTTTASQSISRPGMTTGYHTYGVDIGPINTTFYFDRAQVWQQPTLAAAKAPMFVMVNLALGGGSYNNATGTDYNWNLTPDPTDLKIAYIAVWASPNSPNYNLAPAAPTGLAASVGSSQIGLKWKMSNGATSYNIYRGTSAGGESPTPIATGVVNPSFTDTGLSNGTAYYYKVAAVNSVGTSAQSTEANATPIPPIIVDDAAATYVGAWVSSTYTPGYYGAGYQHDDYTGTGKSAAFNGTIPITGNYQVFIRYTAGANRATNVPVDILHAGVTTTVTVNQRINNNVWVALGAWSFNAGGTNRVTLRNTGANGYVIADAVEWVKAP